MNSYRIVVADDHALFRQGLKGILQGVADLEVVGEAGDGRALLDLLKSTKIQPDLVILDISMPGLRGIEAIPEIRTISPKTRVLIVTMHSDREYLEQTLAAGADGYFLKKDADAELFAAIDRIRKGKVYIAPHLSEDLAESWARRRQDSGRPLLTGREKEVLTLVAQGKSSKEIAGALFISVHTVERHRANIMRKLSLKNTADLVKYAIQKGFI